MPVASITKRLSKTDVGESHTHQSGILVPVAEGREIFPEPLGSPEGDWFDCQDHTGRVWRFKFHHRAKQSESRITGTPDYVRQYRIRSGDSITIGAPATEGAPYTISFAVDDVPLWREGEEIEEAEEAEDTEEGREGWAEGASQRLWVNRYERDPRNRQAAIQQHGVRCLGCDVEMAEVTSDTEAGRPRRRQGSPLGER